MDSLSLTTAGSVDDGKSTLIGRLLLDSQSLPEDQLPGASADGEASPLAWITDGLKAEREQGITIDVAYRYFSTDRRRFVIADAPGHFQYTRNMVTAASTCQLAILLVDARAGVTEQTCRHAFLSSLLGLRSVVLCVNKMDLVDWQESVYDQVCQEFLAFTARLDFAELHTFPISALQGDNVAERSGNMPWYQGPSLLYHLETTHVGATSNLVDARFPVQGVQLDADGRRFCVGRMASGILRPGDEVVVLPSGFSSRVRTIATLNGELDRAIAGQSVAVSLEDELDVGRGDFLVRPNNRPTVGQDFDAMICWFSTDQALDLRKKYVLRHTSAEMQALVSELHYTLDVRTLSRQTEARTVQVNDIARVTIHTSRALLFDSYRVNRATGSFILVDPVTHESVAAGMIR